MNVQNARRGKKGSCFVECIVGGILMIPIALGMMDLGALVIADEMNDAAARQAARSAANEQTEALADQAAELTVEAYAPSQWTTFDLQNVNYSADSVSVKTSVDVKVPFQFPFFSEQTLVSRATMPVLGVIQ